MHEAVVLLEEGNKDDRERIKDDRDGNHDDWQGVTIMETLDRKSLHNDEEKRVCDFFACFNASVFTVLCPFFPCSGFLL
jgi:hypothetical protein